ncbi:hypothetical protein TNCV_4724551 [Trichonephila clavipes]|uniref:Uncharacterized protein n=1 Tax=Trichonephila clavipes TaxID=2585209 RepID=A0A8X7BGB4_TRICX|nr:hypothetical protein TNCV_4724551 [Trichonephila clavipes]
MDDSVCSVSSLHQDAHCARLRKVLSLRIRLLGRLQHYTFYHNVSHWRITSGYRTPEGVKTSKGTTSSAFGENVEAKLIKTAIALDNNSLNHPMDCLVAITDKLNADALIPPALYESVFNK